MDREPEGVEPHNAEPSGMPNSLRALLAVAFVGALGVALVIPLIRGSGTTPSSGAKQPHTPQTRTSAPVTHKPSPTPTPSPSGSLPTRELEIGSKFPHECEIAVAPPSGEGKIAAYTAGGVTIDSIDGTVGARFDSTEPATWSPSARWLLGDDGHLWTDSGIDRGHLFPTGSHAATWLPTADCAFALSKDSTRLLVARPGHDSVDLVDGNLQGFTISPDGSHLGVATSATSTTPQVLLATVDLHKHSASSYESQEGQCCVVFAGAWLDNESPLLWLGPGVSVMSDGAELDTLNADEDGRASLSKVAAGIVPDPSYVTRCGDSLVAVVGTGRPYPTISHKRLATVASGEQPNYLTPQREVYQSPVCSPDGAYVAAVAAPDGTGGAEGHVTIVSSSGGVLQRLTSGSGEGDYNPEWGPSGTGVLFGRKVSGSTDLTLWYAPEGSSARATSIHASLFDWSATPPTGLPAEK